MKKNNLDPKEWLFYAQADLDSAEILLNNTQNYLYIRISFASGN